MNWLLIVMICLIILVLFRLVRVLAKYLAKGPRFMARWGFWATLVLITLLSIVLSFVLVNGVWF